jgi:TalC/MipB family fructose-6-phosphate aldolase
MDWLEPLRLDTERIRQQNIKMREETQKMREETQKIREANQKIREANQKLREINSKEILKGIIKESIQENIYTQREHIYTKRTNQSMKIFLDTADVSLIKPVYDTGLLDGITTNPTLILKSGRQLKEVITEISETFPNLRSISAEVVGDNADEMLKQAADYTAIKNVTIKVPCTVEGLKVCRELTRLGHSVNVTLVFSVAQAILANKAGATYLSPFVGRWMDNSIDGIDLIKNIREVYDRNDGWTGYTNILAASIRDVRQVEQCAKYGADAVKIPPLVFWSMYKNIMTEKGLEIFEKDWKVTIKSSL